MVEGVVGHGEWWRGRKVLAVVLVTGEVVGKESGGCAAGFAGRVVTAKGVGRAGAYEAKWMWFSFREDSYRAAKWGRWRWCMWRRG